MLQGVAYAMLGGSPPWSLMKSEVVIGRVWANYGIKPIEKKKSGLAGEGEGLHLNRGGGRYRGTG